VGRQKLVTKAERALLRRELTDAEEALRRTDELLAAEPATYREGVEARDRVTKAQSELARVERVAGSVGRSALVQQVGADVDRAVAREVPREFGWTATEAGNRVGSAASRFEEFDRRLAANRPERAGDALDEANAELRAARAERERLEGQVAEMRRTEEEASASDWLETITSLIPIEVIAGWTAIQAIVGVDEPTLDPTLYWAVFAVVLVATYLHVRQDFRETAGDEGQAVDEMDDEGGEDEDSAGGSTASQPPRGGPGRSGPDLATVARWSERVQVLLAVGAFVVWVYYLEGPFAADDLHDATLAAVLLPLYTLAGVQLVSSYTTILAGLEFRIQQVFDAIT
jgi:hypothetical protein